MYITIDRPIQRLKSEYTDGEFVEFSENGTAQVAAEIGEQLIEHYDAVTEKE
jgi:hypothetical protein